MSEAWLLKCVSFAAAERNSLSSVYYVDSEVRYLYTTLPLKHDLHTPGNAPRTMQHPTTISNISRSQWRPHRLQGMHAVISLPWSCSLSTSPQPLSSHNNTKSIPQSPASQQRRTRQAKYNTKLYRLCFQTYMICLHRNLHHFFLFRLEHRKKLEHISLSTHRKPSTLLPHRRLRQLTLPTTYTRSVSLPPLPNQPTILSLS